MIGFWIVAGLMIAGALLFVLPPLLGRRLIAGAAASHGQANVSIYRDQLRELDNDLAQGFIGKEHYDSAKAEIERRALEEYSGPEDVAAPAQAQWTLVTGIGVVLPVLAIALYLAIGTPAALTEAARAAPAEDGHALTQAQIESMVAGLAQRLKQNPEDPEGWVMLARSYAAMGRHGDAAAAYGEAVKRVPGNAQLLADYADTLAMAQGRSLRGEPEKIIAQALQADPNNVKALALAGTVAYMNNDYKQAAALWQRVLPLIPADSDLAQRMRASIADAEAQQGGAKAVGGSKPAAAAAGVSGRVSLSGEALRGVAPGDTVFVFARDPNGPRVPLAIFRTRVDALPVEFKLDDTNSMTPERTISGFANVLVGARVSRTGSATPAAGDWESDLVPAALGAKGVAVVIDRMRTN